MKKSVAKKDSEQEQYLRRAPLLHQPAFAAGRGDR